MRRLGVALAVVLLVLSLPAGAGAQVDVPALPPAVEDGDPAAAFAGQGMWIWEVARSEGGDVAAIASRASSAGMSHVVVKAAHGTVRWPQFGQPLVDALHAAGLRVCAYQRALARTPRREARVLAQAVGLGADCLVIDAEIEYQGKYRAARAYVRALRKVVGPSFPVALTSFPYVDLHWNFPYSVFLGPGGAQVNMPQMYWRLLGTSVDGMYARTWAQNAVYGRPLAPLGQSWGPSTRPEIRRFRSLAGSRGALGLGWWAWQHATRSHWAGMTDAVTPPVTAFAARPGFTALRRGSVGDPVRWLQLRLRAAGHHVPVTGRFLTLTARAVARFRAEAGLPPGETVDDATWSALLAAAPIDPAPAP